MSWLTAAVVQHSLSAASLSSVTSTASGSRAKGSSMAPTYAMGLAGRSIPPELPGCLAPAERFQLPPSGRRRPAAPSPDSTRARPCKALLGSSFCMVASDSGLHMGACVALGGQRDRERRSYAGVRALGSADGTGSSPASTIGTCALNGQTITRL